MTLIVVEKHVEVKDKVEEDIDKDEKFNPSNEPEMSNHFPAFSHWDLKHIEFLACSLNIHRLIRKDLPLSSNWILNLT